MMQAYYRELVGYVDWLLVPLYFILLCGVAIAIKKTNSKNELIRKYYLKGFVFKLTFAVVYGLLMYAYYGIGDTMHFFSDALYLKQRIAAGDETLAVIFKSNAYIRETYDILGGGQESGWLVVRIALLLSYISFSRFLVVSLLFAAIAYSGIFKMFETFNSFMPQWHKRTAFLVLFFPSLAMFGSGILKDTVCMASLGWLFYSGNQIFIKKNIKLKYVLAAGITTWIIIVVKVYIIAAFIVPYLLFLLVRTLRKIKSVALRWLLFPFFMMLPVAVYYLLSETINEGLGSYATEKIFESIKEQQQAYLSYDENEAGSVFDIGEFEPTITGFIKKVPLGISATLFRPFLWEAKKPIILLAALESMFILLFSLYVLFKAGLIRMLKKISSDPFVFLCLSFSLIFAAFVGLSTLNFGSLLRYRIPAIPFYLCGIMMILYDVKVINPKKQSETAGLSG